MVSAQGLSLVCLIRAQTDDVHVHRQRRTVPNETVYAIAKKGNLSGIARVVGPASAILAERRRAAGPIEIIEAVVWEVGGDRYASLIECGYEVRGKVQCTVA